MISSVFNFLAIFMLVLIVLLSLFWILLTAFSKKYLNKIELGTSILVREEWKNCPILSKEDKFGKLFCYILSFYFLHFLFVFIIIFVVFYDQINTNFFTPYLISYLSLSLISFLFSLLLNFFWYQKFKLMENKKINNDSDFYKNKVEQFYIFYNLEKQDLKNLENLKSQIGYLKYLQKSFSKKLNKLNSNEYRKIYYLITKHVVYCYSCFKSNYGAKEFKNHVDTKNFLKNFSSLLNQS